jgi:hypothetical protein
MRAELYISGQLIQFPQTTYWTAQKGHMNDLRKWHSFSEGCVCVHACVCVYKKALKKGEMEVQQLPLVTCVIQMENVMFLLCPVAVPGVTWLKLQIFKPAIIHKYNQYMLDIDLVDQVVQAYPSVRKTIMLHKKLFLHMPDITTVTAL